LHRLDGAAGRRVAEAVEHLVLALQHLVEVPAHVDHAVVVLARQVPKQEGDHLERAPARLAHPALVRVLLEVLDPLVLVVALGVVDVGAALAVGEGRDPAGLEHAHHHRGARARQARHHDHRVAVAATTPPGPQAHSVTPNRPFRPKPASRETPKKVARTPSSPPGSGPRLRAGWARAIVSTAESRGRGGSLGYRNASQVRVRFAGTLRTSPPTAQPLVIRSSPTTSVSWW